MKLQNDTYVQKAEGVITALTKNTDKWGNPVMVTTSQIRNLLGMTTDIFNEVRTIKEEKLPEEIRGRINYLKIRCLYEAGRDDKVKQFVEKGEIIACIDEIQGLRSRYLLFSKYMEALVAYHKYLGGKD